MSKAMMLGDDGPDMVQRDPNDLNAHIKVSWQLSTINQ